ncbi:MAG: FkbM family methyltransferase [Symploca sp. SIO2D2]|nr:FkbM family methyltransferase [Symploca sp. SIO2D2]NER21810.1 FkbM family methyltransferase [Symploca sp. SIO1C2]
MSNNNSGVYLHPSIMAHISKAKVKTILELGAGDALDSIALNRAYNVPVYVFECNPESLVLCAENIKNHPDIHLIPKAVWNQTTTLEFNMVVNGNPFASSCFPPNPEYPFEKYECKQIPVNATRLDDWLSTNNFDNVDLLCIDLQGACLEALQGMGNYLASTRYIIAEIEIYPIYHQEALHGEVGNFLKEQGFEQVLCIHKWLTSEGQWVEHINEDPAEGAPGWFADYLFINQRMDN